MGDSENLMKKIRSALISVSNKKNLKPLLKILQKNNIKMEGTKMIKKFTIIVLTSLMFLSTGCSTYNSIVPDWAKIDESK